MNRNLVLKELSTEMNRLQNSLMKLAEKIVLLAEMTYDTSLQKEIEK